MIIKELNTILVGLFFVWLVSCNSNKHSQKEIKDVDEVKQIAHKTFTANQLHWIKIHREICAALNGYRFFIHDLQQQSDEVVRQNLIDKNWKEQQAELKRHAPNAVNLSPYFIAYIDDASLEKQVLLIQKMELEINSYFQKKDDTIDWNRLMQNTIPPIFRK